MTFNNPILIIPAFAVHRCKSLFITFNGNGESGAIHVLSYVYVNVVLKYI